MYTIRVEHEWDMAHRLQEPYKGKCSSVHGHRYKCEVTVGAKALDKCGMVMDFKRLKVYVQQFIDNNWDHAILVGGDDEMLWSCICQGSLRSLTLFSRRFQLPRYLSHTTAENLAQFLYEWFHRTLFAAESSMQLLYVTVWETPECSATYGKM